MTLPGIPPALGTSTHWLHEYLRLSHDNVGHLADRNVDVWDTKIDFAWWALVIALLSQLVSILEIID
jgi:hypothetical protein